MYIELKWTPVAGVEKIQENENFSDKTLKDLYRKPPSNTTQTSKQSAVDIKKLELAFNSIANGSVFNNSFFSYVSIKNKKNSIALLPVNKVGVSK